MSTVNVVEGPVAKNFYFPGLGGAILFGNFNLGCPLDRLSDGPRFSPFCWTGLWHRPKGSDRFVRMDMVRNSEHCGW